MGSPAQSLHFLIGTSLFNWLSSQNTYKLYRGSPAQWLKAQWFPNFNGLSSPNILSLSWALQPSFFSWALQPKNCKCLTVHGLSSPYVFFHGLSSPIIVVFSLFMGSPAQVNPISWPNPTPFCTSSFESVLCSYVHRSRLIQPCEN